MAASKIFVSYRRDDSASHAGRLNDRLVREFGSQSLFMDVDSIPLGANFLKVLQGEVAACDVLVAVIGPDWLDARDEGGARRLDNPNDFVRVEIAAALARDIPVIPVLFDGARIPKAAELPQDIAEISVRNGLEVRHASFHRDVDKLIGALKAIPDAAPASPGKAVPSPAQEGIAVGVAADKPPAPPQAVGDAAPVGLPDAAPPSWVTVAPSAERPAVAPSKPSAARPAPDDAQSRSGTRRALALMLVAAIVLVAGGVWLWPYVTAFLAPPLQVANTKDTARLEPGVPPAESAVAQRALLYDEDPSDPQGKRAAGSAIWRTGSVSSGAGLPGDLAVFADIAIPDRKMTATWSLQRNTDPKLPASHIIEIMFKPAPDDPSGGIQNIPGVMMKASEQDAGTPLMGLSVKVTANYFLIGLSAVASDRDRNIELMKQRPWFDIPIVYANNRRAILAMEKGTSGERAFAQAFAAWEGAKK